MTYNRSCQTTCFIAMELNAMQDRQSINCVNESMKLHDLPQEACVMRSMLVMSFLLHPVVLTDLHSSYCCNDDCWMQ